MKSTSVILGKLYEKFTSVRTPMNPIVFKMQRSRIDSEEKAGHRLDAVATTWDRVAPERVVISVAVNGPIDAGRGGGRA
jgi:hypothetical protein